MVGCGLFADEPSREHGGRLSLTGANKSALFDMGKIQ